MTGDRPRLLDVEGHFRLSEVAEPVWRPVEAEVAGPAHAVIAGTAGAVLVDLVQRTVRWHLAGACEAAAIDVAHDRIAMTAPAGPGQDAVRLFDFATCQAASLALPAGGPAGALAFSPNGWFLAAATGDCLVLFEVATGRARWRWEGELPGLSSLAFSADGGLLAAASRHDRRVVLLRVDGLLPVARWDPEPVETAPAGVQGLALSPGGRLLVAGVTDVSGSGRSALLRTWDVGAHREVRGFGRGVEPAFSRDGRRIAGVDGESEVRVWDVPSREELALLPRGGPHLRAAARVRFGPDGRWLVTWGADAVRAWTLTDGGERYRVSAVVPASQPPTSGRRPRPWRDLVAGVGAAASRLRPWAGLGQNGRAGDGRSVSGLAGVDPIFLAFGPDGRLGVAEQEVA